MSRDTTIAHTMMFLCLGAAALMLAAYQYKPSTTSPMARVRATRGAASSSLATQTTPSLAPTTSSPQFLQPLVEWFGGNPLRSQPRPTIAQPMAQSANPPVQRAEVKLVVDLSDRQVLVYRNTAAVARYPLAVGQSGWETPTGSFQINRMQRNPAWQHPITGEVIPPGVNNPLGNHWIGFTHNGKTEIGFHGTYQEDLIGQAVSHGCLRMRNQDVEALYRQVALGTPVLVRP